LFAVGLGWRVWLQRRRYGTSGVVLFRQRGLWARTRDVLVLLLPLLLVAFTVAQALWPGRVALGRLAVLQHPLLAGLGLTLVAAGIVLMATAQLQMGRSWRIGIDEGASPGLITSGLYRFCRNPIYAAVFLALGGLFLLLPCALTLLLLLATYAGIRRQVTEEESYLHRCYGAQYTAYASRVGRFLPLAGRL
jgi:protein-S-isoprenylcysteine O-methyltransferase Ste14